MNSPLRIAILASHGGSNMQAIIDRIADGTLPARIVLVVSNNSSSGALERARRAALPSLHLSARTEGGDDALDARLAAKIQAAGAQLVVLAGYMRPIGPALLAAYPGRILNIHPALLPRHGGAGMFGIAPHQAALAAGDNESGATVHIVDADYDRGPILLQEHVPILPDDTPETLQQRVLAVEHRIYPEVLRRIARGEIALGQPRVG